MRILRVAQTLYPDVTGGGAYHVHAMSRDQAAMGHDVTVLTVDRGDGRPRRETREGYEVRRFSPSVSALGNVVSVGLARELFGADDVDVVHAHSHLYFATNLAALRRRFDETPLAITNHGLYSQSAPRWLFDLYLRTGGKWTFDGADLAFCYTDTDRRRLRDVGVGTDVAVVTNGIDVHRFSPDGPESDVVDDGPAVLFVGRLVDGKRPADAVDAVARLVADHPDITLYVAGDGPLRESLAERASGAGIADHVRLLGHVDYDEMPALYRAADLLVLPSETEGLPRTVLEALGTATPVVTSALDQLEGFVDHGGMTVPVGDVAGFADAIGELLADGERRERLGTAGRAFVAESYDWDGTVRETTERLAALGE